MSGLFGMFDRRSGSIEHPATPLTGSNVESVVAPALPNDSGVPVTERSALAMSTVYRCTALVSAVGAALPLPVYRRGTRERVESPLMEEPHPELTALDLWRITYAHRCLWGNAYLQKKRNRGSGAITSLLPITPDRVRPFRVRESELNPAGKAFDVTDEWGVEHVMLPHEILHIPGLGYDGLVGRSPVRLAAQAVGLALAAEKYGAKLFGSGNLLSGYLTTDQDLEEDDAIRLQGRWRQKMAGLDRAHDVPVLDSNAKFENVTMPNDDAQFLESRHFSVTEVSRFFGVPPFLLNETEKSTSWGTGLEQQAQGWVTFDLHPQWLAPHEARVTRELMRPDGLYAKYKLQGLLRGDSKARAEFYRAMRELGIFSANDVRELEDEPPLAEGGDQYLQPMNLVPLGTVPTDGGGADEPDDGNV